MRQSDLEHCWSTMATLVRNLLIFFIFSFLFFMGGMIYHLETRLPQKDFSDLLNDIDQKRVTELVVKDDVVQVTTDDGNQYMTVVQEPAYLVSSWHAGSIRVSYRKDYTELLFFGIGLVFAVSLLLVSWLSLRIKPATPASVYANEKLISPGAEGQQKYKGPRNPGSPAWC